MNRVGTRDFIVIIVIVLGLLVVLLWDGEMRMDGQIGEQEKERREKNE